MLNGNDLELLSAYLDRALSASERADLEARLQTDAALRRELERLQATKALIASLPTLSPPRDLRLTRAMIGAPPRRLRVLTSPAFSALSAAAAVILLVIGVRMFSPTGQPPETDAAAFSQIVAVPTLLAPQAGMLSDMQAAPTSTDEQFGYAQAEVAPGESAAESEGAPNDQVFEAPAGAPLVAPAAVVPPSASPLPVGTSVLRFAIPETQIAQGGSGVETGAQLRSSEQADMANNGLAASAPMPQATIIPPVITLSPTASPTPKPSATPTVTPLPTLPAQAKAASGGEAGDGRDRVDRGGGAAARHGGRDDHSAPSRVINGIQT